MAAILGLNQYGKAENRLVRIVRDTPRHQIRDLSVSTSLRGEFAPAHFDGDQAGVLPTDTQKNTVFAYARKHGVGEIEEFGKLLGNRFVQTVSTVSSARIRIDEYFWDRIEVGGVGHDHSFVRSGREIRSAQVVVGGAAADRPDSVVSGFRELVVLKSTGSEFHGFLKDEYTTLAETDDRILATSLTANWQYNTADIDYGATYSSVRQTMLEVFATLHSRALQESLFRMGAAVLDRHAGISEIRMSAPNKHHFLSDLTPFGLDNPGEVFYAADRPYGLIEVAVVRDDAASTWPQEEFC